MEPIEETMRWTTNYRHNFNPVNNSWRLEPRSTQGWTKLEDRWINRKDRHNHARIRTGTRLVPSERSTNRQLGDYRRNRTTFPRTHTPIKVSILGYEGIDLGTINVTQNRVDTVGKDHNTFQDSEYKPMEDLIEWEEWSKQAETWLL